MCVFIFYFHVALLVFEEMLLMFLLLVRGSQFLILFGRIFEVYSCFEVTEMIFKVCWNC